MPATDGLPEQSEAHRRPTDRSEAYGAKRRLSKAYRGAAVFVTGPNPSQNGRGIGRASGHTMFRVSPS